MSEQYFWGLQNLSYSSNVVENKPQRCRSNARSAFTLIELLVVIAIIAILAAILFPVFAQAKAAAKKTADLSNIKQLATAVTLYANDNEDLNPLEAGMDQNGVWGEFNSVPADWTATLGQEQIDQSSGFALNTIQPYIKSRKVMEMPGAPTWDLAAAIGLEALPGKSPQVSMYSYNGLLQAYPSTAVAAPSSLPLFSALEGYVNFLGMGWANPTLYCPVPNQACVYSPDPAAGCGNSNGTTGAVIAEYATAWCNGRGQNYAMADTHAKWRPIGTVEDPGITDWRVDPLTGYDNMGHANHYWVDPSGCYPYLFRPDYDFSFTANPPGQ